MATVNALALSLIQESEESTDDTGFVAKIEKRVNEALHEIGLAADYNPFRSRATFATVIGQAQYNMPAQAREIIQLQFTVDGTPIPMRTRQELARLGIRLENSGRPQAWLEDGVVQSGVNNLLRIRLVPVPASVENIEEEHYFDSADTASASHLQVPDSFLVLVKDRVRIYMLENDQRYDAATLVQRRYEANLARLIRRENSKPSQKIILKEIDLANTRRRRGPSLPGSFPDYGY